MDGTDLPHISGGFHRADAARTRAAPHRPFSRLSTARRCKKMTGIQIVKAIFAASVVAFGCANDAYAQDLAAGESSFRKCSICHAIGEGATNKIGPELNGLDGRKAGSVPDFNYSDANKSSETVWNDASFKEYIKDPNAKVPGTKMIFPGIKNEKEVDDLWASVKQFDSSGHLKK